MNIPFCWKRNQFTVRDMLRGGGYEVPMDRTLAQRWLRAAAEQGHAEAQRILGRYLARGVAGDRDPDSARLWLGVRLLRD